MKKVQNLYQEVKNIPRNFTSKIKSLEEVKKIIGSRPRKKRVIISRGAFDIVHPGHLRHLIYAKTRADILIVSLTSDKHIKRRSISPYVPEELRALNLAALELVDYVIIDKNPWAINHILTLQPDLFIKGHEYSLHGIHPYTREEMDALSTYGGEMIFSPGDIVFSSSRYLTTHKPNLSVEQLLQLMSSENINFRTLSSTIKRFKGIRVHVVGDLIVDKYTQCTILGPSQKSPAFSVKHDASTMFVGGAGVVAKHLKSLGADVIFTTLVGKDQAADFALKDLKKSGVKLRATVEAERPTTIKERYYEGGNRLLLQVDQVDNSPISDYTLGKICRMIKKTSSDALICSDFRHGIFSSLTIPEIIKSIPKKCLKIADSQVSNRWGNILDFKGFDLITPNEKEARFSLGSQEEVSNSIAEKLYNQAECRYLILKLGKDGIITYMGDSYSKGYVYIDTFVDQLSDPIGAGDALLSAATLGLIASKNILQASILGNLAAAIECSKLGNIPVSAKELLDETRNLEKRF